MNSNFVPKRPLLLTGKAANSILPGFRNLDAALKPGSTSVVLGNSAFMRSWAGRRLKASLKPLPAPVARD